MQGLKGGTTANNCSDLGLQCFNVSGFGGCVECQGFRSQGLGPWSLLLEIKGFMVSGSGSGRSGFVLAAWKPYLEDPETS